MPILNLSAADQLLVASGDTPLLEIYSALPAGLYPPFPPVELPGGLSGLLERGGFGQNFFFASEILGVSFLAPSGRTVKAGGQVVKNVQGYDLTRLFVGSFGHLGPALEVTLRLRPGLVAAHVTRPGTLPDLEMNGPLSKVRFLWEDQGRLQMLHFGQPREVEAVLAAFGEVGEGAPADHRALFPDGMGTGEGGPLRDRRFGWVNGAAHPVIPPLFAKVAAAL